MVKTHFFLHRVAGGTGHIGDDGALVAQKRIEQGGFAGIGLAQNHRGHA